MKKLLLAFVLSFGCALGISAAKPTFVDMGTSVLWATELLGVDAEHPYGSYYQAGAIAPYPATSRFAYTDAKAIPASGEWGNDPALDPVTALYGKGMCTPSKAEFEALFAICDCKSSYDYTLGQSYLELTSKVTGNTIRIVGGGYWSYSNDHTSDSDILHLLTSSGKGGSKYECYFFSSQSAASQGFENSIYLNNEYSLMYSYQVLPIFNPDKVVKATALEFSQPDLLLSTGITHQLEVTITPDDTSVKDLEWTSSDPDIATVSSDGQLTTRRAGKCTVTCRTTDGSDLTATCNVEVIENNSGMNFVDMGVSVLWGACEIGADDFTAHGTYYAWGTVDNADNYTGAIAASYKPAYTTESIRGVKRDPNDESKPYDVATEVLGDAWHTPDKAEWNELLDNCTITQQSVDGKTHHILTSKINGNQLKFVNHGYLRETSASPLLTAKCYMQISDTSTGDGGYSVMDIQSSKGSLAPRMVFWLLPIRPVMVRTAAIDRITADSHDTDGLFDVYDISGRKVKNHVLYQDCPHNLRPGVYILVGENGRRFKVAF